MNTLSSCRFCLKNVASNHSVGLFTIQAIGQDLPSCLSKLLLVPVAQSDGLSQSICRTCRNNALSLEKKLIDMQERARSSYQSCRGMAHGDPALLASSNAHSLTQCARLCQGSGSISPLSHTHNLQPTRKRTKDTSGVGVSPFTAQSRPCLKRQYSLTSKRLFEPDEMCKCIHNYTHNMQNMYIQITKYINSQGFS